MLRVKVTKFTDGKDVHGEPVVMYNIDVTLKDSKNSYSISRRYSDFANLYNQVKDLLPPEYKFPNKSLFHNTAQFTKERRVRGFDELLQILIAMQPIQMETLHFLEIDIHTNKRSLHPTYPKLIDSAEGSGITDSSSNDSRISSGKSSRRVNSTNSYNTNSVNYNNNNTSETPRPMSSKVQDLTDVAWKEKMSRLSRHISETHQQADHLDNTVKNTSSSSSSSSSGVPSLQEIIKHEMSKIIQSSLQLSAAVYFGLIMCGIIDVSTSTYARMLVTYLTLALVFAFIQIISIKFSVAED